MMFDHNAYRERCSELHVSEEALQEVIEMTEQKQKKPVRRPLRVGLIAAVVTVALMVTVSAANPEALEWLSATIRSSASIGDYREEIVMDDTGETITALRLPDTAVEERDGRIILTVDGEETDITDALAREGRYVWEDTDNGSQAQVVVTLDEDGKPVWVASVAAAGEALADSEVSLVSEASGTKTHILD